MARRVRRSDRGFRLLAFDVQDGEWHRAGQRRTAKKACATAKRIASRTGMDVQVRRTQDDKNICYYSGDE